MEYKTIKKLLADIRREFRRGDKEAIKVAELKKLEQEGKMMEEFVKKLKKVIRGSRYEGRSLVEEFKREINRTICQRLMKLE